MDIGTAAIQVAYSSVVGYAVTTFPAMAVITLDKETTNNLLLLAVGLMGVWTTYQASRAKKTSRRIEKTTTSTHQLVNSASGDQLQGRVEDAAEKAVIFHRMAEMTKEAGDTAAAAAADIKLETAKKRLQEHMLKQATVDATEAKDKADGK